MKPVPVILLAILVVGGCTPKDRDDAIDKGASITRNAANSAVAVATQAWDKAREEAAKLTPASGEAALKDGEKALEKAKDKLQPGKRLEEAEAELARLRAAINVDRLQAECDDKIAQAEKLQANVGKTEDDVKDKLERVDRSYQDLTAKLAKAQKTYSEARERVDEAIKALHG